MSLTRIQVFDIIDVEREYQAIRWGEKQFASLAEYITYIGAYHARLQANATFTSNLPVIHSDLRKLTSLGVAAMEHNGNEILTPRKNYYGIPQ